MLGVRILEHLMNQRLEELLEESYGGLSSVRPWCGRSCREWSDRMESVEVLEALRCVEGHVGADSLGSALVCVHPLMDVGDRLFWLQGCLRVHSGEAGGSIENDEKQELEAMNPYLPMVQEDQVPKDF